jgi:hypothetical protein
MEVEGRVLRLRSIQARLVVVDDSRRLVGFGHTALVGEASIIPILGQEEGVRKGGRPICQKVWRADAVHHRRQPTA